VILFQLVGQRIAVIFSCIGFGSLLLHQFTSNILRYSILSILILLACVEKLCSIMNMIAVERDWVRQTV
jgi:solute carrier family 40 (iron-regulated transporter), member 1